MNFEMMLLADCVSLHNNESSNRDLISYIKAFGEVCEVRAVAYHDIANLASSSSGNLYKAWLLTQSSQAATNNPDSAVWQSKFVDFIEAYCEQRLTTLGVKQN